MELHLNISDVSSKTPYEEVDTNDRIVEEHQDYGGIILKVRVFAQFITLLRSLEILVTT